MPGPERAKGPGASGGRRGELVRSLELAGEDALRRYGAHAPCLLRPDAYVAATGEAAVQAALEATFAAAG